MGSLRFHVIVRGKRIGIRLKDLESQAIRDYHGPVFFRLMRHTASLQSGSHLTAKRLSMSTFLRRRARHQCGHSSL